MAQSKKSASSWADGPPSTVQLSMSAWPTSLRVMPRSASQLKKAIGASRFVLAYRVAVRGRGWLAARVLARRSTRQVA